MNKNKIIISLGVVLLLLLVNCSFAKPKTRSRPVLQEKAQLEKTKKRLQEWKSDPTRPQPENDLKKDGDRLPDDNKPLKPNPKNKNEKRKPAAPEFKPKPDQLKEKSILDRKKKPIEKTKPPIIKPVPHPFSQPGRFPDHFRGTPSSHHWDNRYDRRSERRYRGSSHFHPHFPRYYYDSWILVQENSMYTRVQLPEQMRIQIACGNYVEFELEENPDTAYQWMASYDAWYSRIDIIHPPKEDKSLLQFLFSKPGKATVQIEALNPGSTMVELFYIRPWEFERGNNPAKRIQLYLDIKPE